MNVNKAIVVGRLGRDPNVRAMKNGDKVASFSIATAERWRDSNGERKEVTDWHNVVVFNQILVTLVEKYLRKGSRCYVEGKMKTRRYTGDDNVERRITEIVLGPFGAQLIALDKQERDDAPPPENEPGPKSSMREEMNDDIPF